MGFDTRRHVGTADHLHVAEPPDADLLVPVDERLGELTQAQRLIVAAEAGLNHHLLGIMLELLGRRVFIKVSYYRLLDFVLGLERAFDALLDVQRAQPADDLEYFLGRVQGGGSVRLGD